MMFFIFSYLRMQGVLYMNVSVDKQCKLVAKAIEAMFVGYEPGLKGYRLGINIPALSICLEM